MVEASELAVPAVEELEEPAPHGELEGLIGQLEAELEAKGYFHPPDATQATKNTIRTIFTKTGWSSREVKAIRGIIARSPKAGAARPLETIDFSRRPPLGAPLAIDPARPVKRWSRRAQGPAVRFRAFDDETRIGEYHHDEAHKRQV